MKKNLFFAIVLLSGCGIETVRSTKEEPFVIKTIRLTNDGKFLYSKNKWERAGSEFFAADYQTIETDIDLGYQVGDTIKFCK